jgi:ADP-L-glycero-D-manno-heptose 6-epimerase
MIILTGAKGFIGQNFKNKLSNNILEVDINNCWDFIKTFDRWNDVELILHQGALSSTTETNIRKINLYNIDFTLYLFEIAKVKNIPVKYASSASVYGNFTSGEFNPLNYYAISKLTIDYWVKDNLADFSLIQGFRYFNVYGNGEEHKGDQASPISKFTKQIKETGKLKLFEGSDKFYRDFVCVDDLVDIVLNNKNSSGIYDLGTSNPVTFQHVAECVASKYEGVIEYVPFPNHLVGKYQDYTCAKKEWGDYKFTSVEEYLK